MSKKSNHSAHASQDSKKGRADSDRLLEEFKAQVSDLLKPDEFLHQDNFLKRWLIARNWNVKRAVAAFRESEACKERMGLSRLMESYNPPEVVKKYWGNGILGFDKAGSVLRVELFGRLDLKGILHSVRKADLERIKLIEAQEVVNLWKRRSEETGRLVDGLVVIVDLEGVSSRFLWKPGLDMYLHLHLNFLDDNFPELTRLVFIINAPAMFPVLWRLGRSFVNERMRCKLHILGSNYREVLLKYVDPDQLPKYMGGTMTDPDGNPRCVTKIGQGGIIPESYYLKELSHTENLHRVTVPRRDKLLLRYSVDVPGSVLRWEFKTAGHDIAFGVEFHGADGEKRSIVKVARVNSHMVPEDGSLNCDRKGTYILVFSNAFSWARSKEICYFAELVPPDAGVEKELDDLTEDSHWDALAPQLKDYET